MINNFYGVLRNGSTVILKVAYGYTVEDDNDPLLSLAEEAAALGSLAGAPGMWLVDSFPIREQKQQTHLLLPDYEFHYSPFHARLAPRRWVQEESESVE
jgi:hypothetical protein